ncbi:MAG: serine/threonine-protein kinase [Planctomycetota bacterium]
MDLKYIGRYEIEEIIGTGVSGFVYKAYDPKLKRHIAIKLLKEDAGNTLISRFSREICLLAQFRNDCIPLIYDMGEFEQKLFAVLEFIEGDNLETQLLNGKVNWALGLNVVHQCAQTLAYIHQFTLHRDLKPTNILIHPSNRPYIVDFGCAKPNETENEHLTKQGSFLGSYQYASIEQILGKEPGPQADIFSLGMILYETLTGALPYEALNVGQLIMHRMNTTPESPHLIRTFIPESLSQICLKAIQRDPEERYSTMVELAQEIEQWKNSSEGASLLKKGLCALAPLKEPILEKSSNA